MSMSMSRRQFLSTLMVGAAGTIALEKLAELAGEALALDGEFITYKNIRFVETTTADNELWYVICHPSLDIEAELRDAAQAELVSVDSYRGKRIPVDGEFGRINSMMKFRLTEVLPPFERPVPRQVFRGAQWKHEQRPYHTRFA